MNNKPKNNKNKKNIFEKVKNMKIKEKAKQVGAIVTGGVLTSLAMGSGPKAVEMNKKVDILDKSIKVVQVDSENINKKSFDSFKEYREAYKASDIAIKMRQYYKQELEKRISNQKIYFSDKIAALEEEVRDKTCRQVPEGQMGGFKFGQVSKADLESAKNRLEKALEEKKINIEENETKLKNADIAKDEEIEKFVKEDPNDFLNTTDENTKTTYLKLEELRAKGESNLNNFNQQLEDNRSKESNLVNQKILLKPEQDKLNNTNTIAYTVGGIAGSFVFKKKKKGDDKSK